MFSMLTSSTPLVVQGLHGLDGRSWRWTSIRPGWWLQRYQRRLSCYGQVPNDPGLQTLCICPTFFQGRPHWHRLWALYPRHWPSRDHAEDQRRRDGLRMHDGQAARSTRPSIPQGFDGYREAFLLQRLPHLDGTSTFPSWSHSPTCNLLTAQGREKKIWSDLRILPIKTTIAPRSQEVACNRFLISKQLVISGLIGSIRW